MCGETDSPFNGDDDQPWNGIWGGFIDAVTHTKVANNVFPISLIWAHHVDDANALKWRPVTAYNGVADQFVVAWKETPSPHANNMTNKNHIRAGNRDSLTTSSGANVVVSSTSDTENPALPCIAPSAQTNKCLIAWEDHRNDFGDIYGSFINSTTLATSNLSNQVVPNDKQYWKKVSAGDWHSLGIRSDGTLWAWGRNCYGQLGLGDQTDRSRPIQVGNFTDWIDIAAGAGHSLGIRSNGTLWAWGWNIIGQLGLGDTTDRSSPDQVGILTDWVDIAAGGSHSLGIRSNGTLWAWGYNVYGQLGLGNTEDRHEPTMVSFPILAMPWLYLLLLN